MIDLEAMRQDFSDEDADKDEKLSLEEWLAGTFHDEPQHPVYDDDWTEEELKEHRDQAEKDFKKFDKNGSWPMCVRVVCM